MRIDFQDKSYIEVKKSDEEGKILVIVQAKDTENPRKNITNICEITIEQLKELYLEAVKIEEQEQSNN